MKPKHWYKPKYYTHLTDKLSIENARFVYSYVANPDTISHHKFFPLLHRTIVEKKYKVIKKDEKGNITRSHHKYVNGQKKTTAKFREIFYANHMDAHIYSYYTHKILSPLYEKELSKNPDLNKAVIGYRRIETNEKDRCKCNIDFANEVFEMIKNLPGSNTIMAFDISKFFDSINHKILKQKWCALLNRRDLPIDHYKIYKSLINFSYIELDDLLKEFGFKHPNQLIEKNVYRFVSSGEEFRQRIKYKGLIKQNPFRHEAYKHKIGIPQGTPISAFLANLFLLDYDKAVIQFLFNLNATYRRYSDDILVICPTSKEKEIENFIIDSIKKFGLTIQEAKTQKTRFLNGRLLKNEFPVKYLGFEFDGKNKRLKSASISKYYRNFKCLIKFKARRAQRMKNKFPERAFIFRKKIYQSYSHLGSKIGNNRKRNFLSYVNLAIKVMGDNKIKKQLCKSWLIINKEIDRYNTKYNLKKSYKA